MGIKPHIIPLSCDQFDLCGSFTSQTTVVKE